MRRAIKSLDLTRPPETLITLQVQRSEQLDSEFIPFARERDSLGRLLSKSKREISPEPSLPKIKSLNKERLLSQIYKDSFSGKTMTSLSSREHAFAFEEKTWVRFLLLCSVLIVL